MSLRRIQLFANNMSTTHHQNEHTVENYFGENHTGVDSWSEIGDKHEHDYTDWDYMTNGTGGCAQTGRRDVPLTASIKDGKLYCSEAWNEYAMRWDYWNLGFRWIDCQHKTFTMTVEDVERANNPQPFQHGKDEVSPYDWENDSDCESLTYRSDDHNAYHPHSEHWEDLVDSNKQAVCELNKKMLGLKTDIRRLRFEEMVWRNQQHPLLVQKISNIFQTAKDSMGSEWKTVIDDIRMTACQKTRMIIHQLVNFFDTFEEEYDIQMKEANEILCCRLYNIQESLESPTTFEEEDWSNTDPFVLDLLQDEVNDLHIQKTTLLNKPFRIHKHLTHFLKLHQIHQNPETFMYTPLSITLDISTHSMDPNCIGESDDFSFSKLSYDAQIANVRRRIVNAENLFGLSRCEEDVPAPHELFYRLNNISDVIRQKNSTSTCDALRKGLYDYLLL